MLAVWHCCYHRVTQCEHQWADCADVDCPLMVCVGENGVQVVGVILWTRGMGRHMIWLFYGSVSFEWVMVSTDANWISHGLLLSSDWAVSSEFLACLQVAQCQCSFLFCGTTVCVNRPVLASPLKKSEITRRCKSANFYLVNLIHRQTCIIKVVTVCFQVKQNCKQ